MPNINKNESNINIKQLYKIMYNYFINLPNLF